jgi:hypothetical protein
MGRNRENSPPHVVIGRIGYQAHRVTEPLESRGYIGGVMGWVGKRGHVSIGTVANDEGDLRLGAGRFPR